MITKKKTIILMAVLVFALVSAQGAFAQVEGDDDFEDEIEMVNDAAEENPEALLVKLSVTFDVDLALLQDLSAQGYAPGEIWLALEVSSSSEISLQDALILTDGSEGHGWGVLATTLGIAPGSDAFHALKLKWGEHKGTLVREMNQKRENYSNKGENDDTPKGANGKRGVSGSENSGSNKRVGKN